ncbi:PqqD family protein [Sediminicoccus rosea]|uniref:PqqD family protein n=1 Tax=Sediminicoccus rosea TaxID=1225128 RepID=A0ABZ0PCD5_9PROT|nr:PqqD family protein [Sediminicoccus rosea]WPB82956.1 PqqD family protein [Sediminicoccus rosea]
MPVEYEPAGAYRLSGVHRLSADLPRWINTTMSSMLYVSNAAVVASEQFDGELVVIQFDTGRYFSLSGMAMPAWQLLQSPVTRDAMLFALSQAAGDTAPEPAELASQLDALIEQLVAEALLIEAEAPGIAAVIEPFNYAAPRVDIYSDLADLVSLDPIHDVDAMMGWPRTGAA